jgi:hypothetical protein
MQFSYRKRQVGSLLIGTLTVLGHLAAAEETGCAKNPSGVVIPSVHLTEADNLAALTDLASQYRVCLGVHTNMDSKHKPVNAQNVSILEVLEQYFPDHKVSVTGNVILVQSRARADWLNYRVKKFSTIAAPLTFNAHNLWLAIKYQVAPNPGGIVGHVPSEVADNVNLPFTALDKSVRDLLTGLIEKSSKGGAWIVVDTGPEVGTPPLDEPFWKIVPYGGDATDLH